MVIADAIWWVSGKQISEGQRNCDDWAGWATSMYGEILVWISGDGGGEEEEVGEELELKEELVMEDRE